MRKRNKILLLALASVLLMGCKTGDKTSEIGTDSSRIYVSSDRVISNSVVYTSEATGVSYSQEELNTFAEAAVIAYNEAKGAGSSARNTEGAAALPVSLKSCTLEGQTGKLVFEYAGGDDLAAFSQATKDDSHTVTRLEADTVANAAAAGRLTGAEFKKPDGSAAKLEDVIKQGEWSIVVVDGAATLQSQGAIAYISDGVQITDDFTAQLPEGTHSIIFK